MGGFSTTLVYVFFLLNTEYMNAAQEVLVPITCYTEAIEAKFKQKKKVLAKLRAKRDFSIGLDPCSWAIFLRLCAICGTTPPEVPQNTRLGMRDPRQLYTQRQQCILFFTNVFLQISTIIVLKNSFYLCKCN